MKCNFFWIKIPFYKFINFYLTWVTTSSLNNKKKNTGIKMSKRGHMYFFILFIKILFDDLILKLFSNVRDWYSMNTNKKKRSNLKKHAGPMALFLLGHWCRVWPVHDWFDPRPQADHGFINFKVYPTIIEGCLIKIFNQSNNNFTLLDNSFVHLLY